MKVIYYTNNGVVNLGDRFVTFPKIKSVTPRRPEMAVRLDATSHRWAVVAGCCEQQRKETEQGSQEKRKDHSSVRV